MKYSSEDGNVQFRWLAVLQRMTEEGFAFSMRSSDGLLVVRLDSGTDGVLRTCQADSVPEVLAETISRLRGDARTIR